MKRLKILFTVLCALCSTMTFAHDFEVDSIYYNITDATNKTVAVTYSGSSYNSVTNEYTGSVVIPESVSYNGKVYSVTSIGNSAFYNCDGLTSVTIPNSVTSIGDSAFSGCSGLTRADIVDGVKSIGLSAFAGCNKLEEVYISNTIESIGEMAFSGCTNIFEIWVGSKKAIAGNENIFSEDTYNNALLHVPQGRKFAYERTAPWSRFHIVEMDFTGVEDINEQGTVNNIVYDLRGSVVENPINGIYIVNGKKVLVK